MEQLFRIGIISSTHGIRGEVKVFPTTDDNARFKELTSVLLDTGKEHIRLEIQNVKFFKQFVILKFKGIDTGAVHFWWNARMLFPLRRMNILSQICLEWKCLQRTEIILGH